MAVFYRARADEREQDVVVLLALVLVDGGDARGEPEERVGGAAGGEHVPDEVLLPVVGGEDGDALRGVAEEAHVLEARHHVLSLAEVLVEERARGGLPAAQEVDLNI